MAVTLSEREIETIIDLIHDWGWEYALTAERSKVAELALKLEMDPKWVAENLAP